MKKKIAELIDLKSIITLSITGCFVYGFIVGKIATEQYMIIASSIYTYYFTRKISSKGDENMATTDTRSVEEIKEDIAKVETPIEEENTKEED